MEKMYGKCSWNGQDREQVAHQVGKVLVIIANVRRLTWREWWTGTSSRFLTKSSWSHGIKQNWLPTEHR